MKHWLLSLALIGLSSGVRAQERRVAAPSEPDATRYQQADADRDDGETRESNETDSNISNSETDERLEAVELDASAVPYDPNQSVHPNANSGGIGRNDAENSRSPSTIDAPLAFGAKYALAIAGDPDRGLLAYAANLDRMLEERNLIRVGDTELRNALLSGDTSSPNGEPLSEARRNLSSSQGVAERQRALNTIGRLTDADAIVLVQRASPHIRIYDIGAESFFERGDDTANFTASAIRAAARRARTSPASVAIAASAPTPADISEPPEPPERPARRFFRKNWPYIVGGLLLVGALSWVIVGARRDDPDPEIVLRFQPGP